MLKKEVEEGRITKNKQKNECIIWEMHALLSTMNY